MCLSDRTILWVNSRPRLLLKSLDHGSVLSLHRVSAAYRQKQTLVEFRSLPVANTCWVPQTACAMVVGAMEAVTMITTIK